MYCSREYQTSTRLNQQYEKSTLRYMDVYDDIYITTSRFDENVVSMTYLGRIDMKREEVQKYFRTRNVDMVTGASRSKSYFLIKSLHKLV